MWEKGTFRSRMGDQILSSLLVEPQLPRQIRQQAVNSATRQLSVEIVHFCNKSRYSLDPIHSRIQLQGRTSSRKDQRCCGCSQSFRSAYQCDARRPRDSTVLSDAISACEKHGNFTTYSKKLTSETQLVALS